MRLLSVAFVSGLLIGSAHAQRYAPFLQPYAASPSPLQPRAASPPLQPHAGSPAPERLDTQHFCYANGVPYSEGWVEGKLVCSRRTEGGPLEWMPSTKRPYSPGAR